MMGVELIVHFPQQLSVIKGKEDCKMDVPYLIPGGVVPGSAALASPPLLPDSKSLLSESDIQPTSLQEELVVPVE